jgi:hypothetical protein
MNNPKFPNAFSLNRFPRTVSLQRTHFIFLVTFFVFFILSNSVLAFSSQLTDQSTDTTNLQLQSIAKISPRSSTPKDFTDESKVGSAPKDKDEAKEDASASDDKKEDSQNSQKSSGKTSAAETPENAEMPIPAYPEGTLAVFRIKSFRSIDQAVQSLKTWVHQHPTVESLFDDEWPAIEKFDLRISAARALDLSPKDFDNFFEGEILLYISGDFESASKTKMLPASIVLKTHSAASAKSFLELLKSQDEITEVSVEHGGIQHLRVTPKNTPDTKLDSSSQSSQKSDEKDEADESPSSSASKSKKIRKPFDLFVVIKDERVIIANTLDYTVATQNALTAPPANNTEFWSKVSDADLAGYLDLRPFWAKLKEQIQQKAKDNPNSRVDPKLIDELGLDEIAGVGLRLNFTPFNLQSELDYALNPTGIAKIITCTPTGLEPSSLIPKDATEFTLGRMDLNCTWTEIRRLMKIAVPSSVAMYDGWAKELETSSGVNIDRQIFGALGERYIVYSRTDKGDIPSTAVLVALNDSVAFQGGVDALLNFISQGKDLFTKDKVGSTTVWRLKSEFQGNSSPAIAYAITPSWLIVSIGNPTQMQDLVESVQSQSKNTNSFESMHEAFNWPTVKEVLSNPSIVGFAERPLKDVMNDFFVAYLEVKKRESARKTLSENPEDDESLTPEDFVAPVFDDVNESVLFQTESRPGAMVTTIKIVQPNE